MTDGKLLTLKTVLDIIGDYFDLETNDTARACVRTIKTKAAIKPENGKRDEIRNEALESAAAVVDYEFDRLWKEIYGRSGNAGVTKMRTQPLEVIAEQIRALKSHPIDEG